MRRIEGVPLVIAVIPDQLRGAEGAEIAGGRCQRPFSASACRRKMTLRPPEQGDQIDRIGLRRRDRHCTRLFGPVGPVWFSMACFCAKAVLREGQKRAQHSRLGRSRPVTHRNSASSAARLSAEETMRTRLPMVSIRRLNSSGAAACAIRAGAPICRGDSRIQGPKIASGSVPPRNRQDAVAVPWKIAKTLAAPRRRAEDHSAIDGLDRRVLWRPAVKAAEETRLKNPRRHCAGPISAPANTACAEVAPAASMMRGRCAAIAPVTVQAAANTNANSTMCGRADVRLDGGCDRCLRALDAGSISQLIGSPIRICAAGPGKAGVAPADGFQPPG